MLTTQNNHDMDHRAAHDMDHRAAVVVTKSWPKSLRALTLALVMAFGMTMATSCADDPLSYNLIGSWEAADGCMYVFNGDGSGYYTFYDYYYDDWFTSCFDDYMVSNDCLYVLWCDSYDFENMGYITMSSNSFQIGGEVFWRNW